MAKNKAIRIILDTNLWISFIISRKYNLLDNLLFSEKVRLVFSNELIDEIQQTILKPKLKRYFADQALDKMLWLLNPL